MRPWIALPLLMTISQGCFGESDDDRLVRLEAAGLGVEDLVREATAWVRAERDRHRPQARELTAAERARLEPYFEATLLAPGWATGLSIGVMARGEGALSVDDLALVHDRVYIESIEHFCAMGGGQLDADTSAAPGSWTTARRSAGAVVQAIEALRALKRPCTVDLTTDSEYVKNGITTWLENWKKKGWKTSARKPVKNVDLWQALDEERQRHEVRWHWVKGHSGHSENERADQLANRGIDELGR